jgi:hypothetical protein
MNDFSVPVAILNFNRPHLTRRVFEVVRQIKPRRLLLIADGPRASRPDDIQLCAEVRAIFDEIDWNCEVSRKFSDTNLGSFKSNSSGLNWVFNTVEEAIIIEDDCVPSLSFFRYCEELLERYRDDPRVGVISGDNFGFPNVGQKNDSYFFSAYTLNWAWASWRRVWRQVDLDMSWWEPETGGKMLRTLFPQSAEWRYWYGLFEHIHRGEMKNAWDYQLILSSFRHSQCCIIPRVNLVSNVGFGPEGTNCMDESSLMHDVPRGELEFPMMHPLEVRRCGVVDCEIFRIRFRAPPQPLWVQVKHRLLLKSKLVRTLNHARKKILTRMKAGLGL